MPRREDLHRLPHDNRSHRRLLQNRLMHIARNTLGKLNSFPVERYAIRSEAMSTPRCIEERRWSRIRFVAFIGMFVGAGFSESLPFILSISRGTRHYCT